MTLRVDRSKVSASEAIALDDALDCAARRRERNLTVGDCINNTLANTHGIATHGVRCFRCYLTHKHGVVIARSMLEYKAAHPVFVREEVAA